MSHRFFMPVAGATLLLAAGWLVLAQTPPVGPKLETIPAEEEDPNPPATKRKIIIEDEPPPPVSVPRGCYYVRMDDLARAALDTKSPVLKAILRKYIVAFDRITDVGGGVTRVCPVPLHKDAKFPAPYGVFPLTEADEPKPVLAIDPGGVRSLEQYEEMLLKEADALLAPPAVLDTIDPVERLATAEHLLTAAGLFLDGARDQSKRRGPAWDKVKQTLAERLMAVRMLRLKQAAERKDWPTVRTRGLRMASLYPANAKLQEEIIAVRLSEALLAAGSDQLADLDRAKDLLTEFESRFPGSKNDAAENVRLALDQQAEKLFKRAEAALRGDQKDAPRLLRTLEAIQPNYPGLRDLQGQLKAGYSVLYVGVKRLPQSMSPLTAQSDAEKMAVELLFEGLLEAVPDDGAGLRYRPALAAGLPTVGGAVRDFRLVRPIDWAGLPREYFDAADVARTLKLLKGDYRHTWAAAGAEWLGEQPRIDDPAAIRLNFSGGHPFPLSVFEFKILPTRWLQTQGLRPDDPKFGLKPYGTGPYRHEPAAGPAGFVANPSYGRRPGRLGQPFIKEVRFVDWTKLPNPASHFKDERLHILTDVPTADLQKYVGGASGLTGRVQVVTAASDRRLWLLAMNHRRPALRSVPLRRGLAHAIDRDDILTQCFRAGSPQFHKPLSGPFPEGTWAVPRTPPPLFDRDLALAKFAEHARATGSTTLRLLVPDDDARARKACDLIKKQIETAGSTAEGKVTIIVEPLSPADFDRIVYREASFDLAYVPFDYPDDVYPFGLGAFLDPTATAPGGRNVAGYLDKQANVTPEDETLGRQLVEIRRHADFAGKLVPQTHDLHRRFIDAMPFVPLWQLDRHTVLSAKLQLFFDDDPAAGSPRQLPPTLFPGVARWKLE